MPAKAFLLLCPTSRCHTPPQSGLPLTDSRFAGDPAPNSTTDPNAIEENPSVIEKVKMGFATTAKSFMVDMWLARQTPEKVLPLLRKVVEGAKEEFADAVANGGGVYAVGYCFGGKYVCLLAAELPDSAAHGQAPPKDEEAGMAKAEPVIKAGALAHGTLITKDDLQAIKSPISMACVENDQLFPDDVRSAGKTYLEENNIKHEIKVYSGVPHGFAVIGEYDDSKIQTAQEEAFEQMLEWLKAH